MRRYLDYDHFKSPRPASRRIAATGLIEEKKKTIRKHYKSAAFWSPEHLQQVAEGAVRADVAAFQNFCGTRGGANES